MNKSYRSVWNESIGAWVAASELGAARGKPNKVGRIALSLVLAAAAWTVGTAHAQADAHYVSNNDAGYAGGNYNNDGASGFLSTAVGINTTASGIADTAMGLDANASGGQATAIGSAAKAAGHSATAVGEQSNAAGFVSSAVGAGAQAQGAASVAIGAMATGSQADAIAVGNRAQSTAAGATAIGVDTAAGAVNGVALGSLSVADRAAGVAGYVPPSADAPQAASVSATQGTLGAVSVGDAANGKFRQVTGVAAGTEASDAVNVSQLQAVNAAAVAGQTHYVSVNDGDRPGANYDNDGATGRLSTAIGVNTTAGGVAGTALGLDASAGGAQSVALGSAANSAGHASTAVGEQSNASGDLGTAIGAGAQAQGNASIAVGPTATATQAHGIALGNQAQSNGVGATAFGLQSRADAAHGVALGSFSVAARGAGVAGYVPPSADAAQGASILATQGTLGAVAVGDASTGRFRQITGVAAGTEDSDAANVAQLKAVSAAADAAGNKWIIGSPTTYVAPISTGADSTAVGSGAVVNATNSVAVGTGAKATTDNSVALGNGSTTSAAVATTGTTIQGTNYTFAGGAPAGVVSVGSQGNERQVTNVAAGQLSATSTDAVNGSQLYATNQAINNIQAGGGIKYFHANSAAADSQAAGAESIAVGPQTVVDAANGVGVGNGAAVQQGATGGVALGSGASVTQAGGVALGQGAVASTAPGAAGYVPATATDAQRQAILATTGTQGAVSVGDAANGQYRQINGVAAGTQDSDAANVAQLKGVQASVNEVDQNAIKYQKNGDTVNYNDVTLQGDGGTTIHNLAPGVQGTDAANVNQVNAGVASANAYTDARVNRLSADIDNVAKNAYAGVASAMAIQVPGTFAPGKTVMRVGTAVFKGETAVGVSFRRTAENNGWSLTGGVGVSSAGAAATVGAEWVFN